MAQWFPGYEPKRASPVQLNFDNYEESGSAQLKSRSLAIDTHSLIFRSFFAARQAPDPVSTGLALTKRMLLTAIDRIDPHYVVAAADCPEPTFRHLLDEQYKASRNPTPPELKELLPKALDHLQEIGIPVVRCPGYEADDILATLAIKIKNDHTLHVLSSDRDLVGLVRPGVNLLLMQNGGRQKMISSDNASDLFGVPANQVADYKALVGDSSDNIPGVKGIGPKTVVALLQKYGSLEEILKHRQQLTGKAALLNDPDAVKAAEMCQQLAELHFQVPVQLDASSGLWTSDKLAALRSS